MRSSPFVAAFILPALLLAASVAVGAPPSAPTFAHDPASACTGAGGTYIGGLKCRMPDGAIAQILTGADAFRAHQSSSLVLPGTRHSWALAATVVNFEFNGNRHDLLAGTYATPDAIDSDRKLLWNWWGIGNHAQLLRMLKWLQFEGGRANFRLLGLLVGWIPEPLYQNDRRYLSRVLTSQELNRFEIAHKYYSSLGDKGILAWDLIRYINLCRWGYAAGYLSETDAWVNIMAAARRLQLTYTSWQDLESAFLIGRSFCVFRTNLTADSV